METFLFVFQQRRGLLDTSAIDRAVQASEGGGSLVRRSFHIRWLASGLFLHLTPCLGFDAFATNGVD